MIEKSEIQSTNRNTRQNSIHRLNPMKNAPHQRLVMAGDRDGLKELLRRRLVECGWRDQVKLICKEIIKEKGHEVTYDTMLATVTSRARSLVPDSVKKELLQKIKSQLLAQEEKLKI